MCFNKRPYKLNLEFKIVKRLKEVNFIHWSERKFLVSFVLNIVFWHYGLLKVEVKKRQVDASIGRVQFQTNAIITVPKCRTLRCRLFVL